MVQMAVVDVKCKYRHKHHTSSSDKKQHPNSGCKWGQDICIAVLHSGITVYINAVVSCNEKWVSVPNIDSAIVVNGISVDSLEILESLN